MGKGGAGTLDRAKERETDFAFAESVQRAERRSGEKKSRRKGFLRRRR